MFSSIVPHPFLLTHISEQACIKMVSMTELNLKGCCNLQEFSNENEKLCKCDQLDYNA